jgi:hypothetical protein
MGNWQSEIGNDLVSGLEKSEFVAKNYRAVSFIPSRQGAIQ